MTHLFREVSQKKEFVPRTHTRRITPRDHLDGTLSLAAPLSHLDLHSDSSRIFGYRRKTRYTLAFEPRASHVPGGRATLARKTLCPGAGLSAEKILRNVWAEEWAKEGREIDRQRILLRQAFKLLPRPVRRWNTPSLG